ncbi:MAG TPA: hypothetical protein VNJ04_19755 [Gemmatimonadaceae bacterium]|nr:hypothetical protein [Gemmatimonadaceae bacterium]
MAATRRKTLLALVARTANETSAAIATNNARDVTVDINLDALSATSSVTFTVQGLDSAAGEWFDLLATAAIATAAAPTRVRLSIGPDFATTANVSAAGVLPVQIRVATSGTWTTGTFSALAHLIS